MLNNFSRMNIAEGIRAPGWFHGVEPLTHSEPLARLQKVMWKRRPRWKSISTGAHFSPGAGRRTGSRVADRVLLLWPGVRPESLRWESWVQDIGPPETSWLHVISIVKSSPRDLHLNAKTQLHSTTSKLQCSTPYAKQLTRQEHNPTISREAA